MLFIAERTPIHLGVIKSNRHSGLGNPSLSLLVDELLQISGSNLLEVGDTQHEADGIEDVGFPGAVQTRDGVEMRVETRNHSPRGV